MSTYVLVPGSWHGAWCWYKIIPRLQRQGHTVIAPDLQSLGSDKTPSAGVTLDLWTTRICEVLDAQAAPVILVGHSRGGIVVSQAAERRPDKVRVLVYLAAFLLRDGESLLQVAQQDGTSILLGNLVVDEAQRSAVVRPEVIEDAFYGDCSDEDVALARTLLQPEALAPIAAPITISDARFGRVPRIYIECLRDKAVPPRFQRRMYTDLPCQRVLSIDCDHSPFFSRPDELTAHLLSL